ncbi:MAG TPA: non-ribosomal peptide synthetase [Steroidobacteraceae bacterium]|nr:non-ribosomal peptide synthetase [Steroidobacteraceae bacterium]
MKLQKTIHATFAARAAPLPDRVALDSGDRSLTFAELDARSTRIAGYLQHHGVRRGDRVGVFSQRSIDAVAALLGILKAGAAYVPFDPAYPAKLLRFMYRDCTPTLMLVDSSLLASGTDPFWTGPGHDMRGAAEGVETPHAAAGALPETGPDDLAYVMYTSGSTGHPKGVLIPHRGVVRLVVENPFASMGPDEVHLLLAPLAFDASTFEIWGALLNGAKLAVVTAPYPSLDDIAQAISRFGVTTLWLTAGLFHLMVDHRLTGLAPLRQLIAGGDVLSPPHIAKAQAALPGCQLINGYGPTENTTFTCCYSIPRELPPGPIPIGTPIAHTSVHILDEAGGPVIDGQEGELYAGGEGLALGYLNRDELTAERFVANPFDPSGSTRLYRTGDRVRRRTDGNIEFLGRVDRQVKINGKRVELDEIEACLRRSPLVEDAAVTAPINDNGPRKVHAYVKLRVGAGGGSAELRHFLKQEAADYMIPATFTLMDELPLSPTGKVDRSRLPRPRTDPPPGAVQPAAGNETETMLLELWRKVLGTGAVGLNDNFFDLGGTSLQLLQVHATIASVVDSDLTVVDLFEYPRISALAARLRSNGGTAVPGSAAGRQPAGGVLTAEERARRQHAALARARTSLRRGAPS